MRHIGTLSALFPGAAHFGTLQANYTSRSRLCEIIWLEPALFLSFKGPLIALTEGFYTHLSTGNESKLRPGSLGEQFVFRSSDIDSASVSIRTDDILQLGDSRLTVTEGLYKLPISVNSPAISEALRCFPPLQISISEEGLVEPGAPLYLL